MWQKYKQPATSTKVLPLESIIYESRILWIFILWINMPISCTSKAVLITLVTVRLKSKAVAFST